MMQSVKNIFPEILESEFIKKREIDWELAMSIGGWKSEYRKKDLDSIKEYFFTGEYDENNVLASYRGNLLGMFPVQRSEGYNYFYSQHELTSETMGRLAISASLSKTHNGMDEKAHLNYFDYHLGEAFKPTVTRHCKNGPVEASINAKVISITIMSGVRGYIKNSASECRFATLRLPYLFSALKWVKSDEIFTGPRIDDLYLNFFKVILTKKFKGRKRKNDDRIRVAEEFSQLLETTDGLPDKFLELWNQAKSESKDV